MKLKVENQIQVYSCSKRSSNVFLLSSFSSSSTPWIKQCRLSTQTKSIYERSERATPFFYGRAAQTKYRWFRALIRLSNICSVGELAQGTSEKMNVMSGLCWWR